MDRVVLFFFFSSRRRHTRFDCDWSSDVCSSDLGQQTGVDMPGESKGLLRRLENWSAISIGSISMGQEVGVTPIQLISAVSAIANGGMLYKPHVIAQLRRGDQVLPAEGSLAPSEPRRVIRPETAATLRRLMEGVILNGTGPRAPLTRWARSRDTGSRGQS